MRLHILRKWLIGLTSFLWVIAASGQVSEIQLKNISRKDGLPSNEAYCIFKDSKNYLWIGTDQGVVRYNGSKMEHFSLPDNVIFKIREDEKGRIWFFSHTGLLSYYEGNIIHPYKYNSLIQKEIKSLLITDARVFKDEVMINSFTRSNYILSDKGDIETRHYFTTDTSISTTFQITEFENGFFASKQSDCQNNSKFIEIGVKRKEARQKFILPFGQRSLGQYGVIAHENVLYFFNSKFIARLNEDGSYICKNMPAEILSIGFGNNNNIWIGMLRAGALSLNMNLEEDSSGRIIEKLSVSSVCRDNEGGEWFSTLEKGIFYLQKNSMRLVSATGSAGQSVYRISKADDSTTLFANSKGIYRLGKLQSDAVLPLTLFDASDLFVREGNIYLSGTSTEIKFSTYGTAFSNAGSRFRHVFLYESSTELITADDGDLIFNSGNIYNKVKPTAVNNPGIGVLSIAFSFPRGFTYKDSTGKIWLGNSNGLYTIDHFLEGPKKFTTDTPLPEKGITAMRQMRNGMYVLGIRFGGIALMQGNKILANITEEQGLSGNSVKHILIENDSVWVTTAKGVSLIKFTSFAPVKYEITNLADDKNVYDMVIYQLENFNDKILAATSNGIYCIEKNSLTKTNTSPIPFYINSVTTQKGDTSGISTISLPFKYNRLAVNFSAISYNAFDHVSYYYRFANLDTSWQEIKTTELLLENLSPGIYALELKAINTYEGRSSAVQKLEVNIMKPWWQSTLSKIALVLFMLSVFYILFFSRVRKIQQKSRERLALREKMLELEHAALQAQMDPHFIFNCLTSIQQLIVLGETTKANQYLVKFSRLMRMSLELSSDSYIKAEDEKNYLDEYLSLEQLRFPDMFDFSVEINAGMPNGISLPRMMVQPLVENCIRHGVRYLKDRKGKISVHIKKEDASVLCIITDNGIGRKQSALNQKASGQHVSYGINLVKKRLEIFNGPGERRFYIEVEDLFDAEHNPAGMSVHVYMPYKLTTNA